MSLLSRLGNLWRNLAHKAAVDADLDDEVRSYVDLLAESKTAVGADPPQARREALAELGGIEPVKQGVREARTGYLLEATWRDFWYGVRMLRRNRVFTVVAVVTLGLGVGANSAIFSVVNSVLLRSLPFDQPDRLIRVEYSLNGALMQMASLKDFADWQSQSDVFERLVACGQDRDSLGGPDGAERIDTADVSAGFFEMLRVAPILGRTFLPDDQPGHRLSPDYPITGADGVVILGEEFWRQRYSADPNIIGRRLVVDGYPSTVVGIVPDRFSTLVGRAKMWFPWAPTDKEPRDSRYVPVIGRLKPGVSVQQASAQMATIAARLEQEYPETNLGFGATVLPLAESIVGGIRPMLLILFGAVVMVLLIACANVANLLLARSSARARELAVRSALGASRARIIRQLVTEGLTLSVLGGGLGCAFACVAVPALIKLAPGDIPRLTEVGLDGKVLGFTLLLSLATTLIFALAPAFRASRMDSGKMLNETGRGNTGGRRRSRMRGLLVVSELAVSVVLLVGAGLLIRSFYRLRSAPPGFNPHNVIVAEVDLPEPEDRGDESRREFYTRLETGLDSIPGAASIALSCSLPLRVGGQDWEGAVPEGRPYTRAEFITGQYRRVSPGYFRAMEIPLVEGRDFDRSDERPGSHVVIVSQSMAKKIWPGQDPIGKRLLYEDDGKGRATLHEVIGVAGDVKWWGLDTAEDLASYVPFFQDPLPFVDVVARSTVDGQNVAPAIKEAVRSIDPDLPVDTFRTMDQALDNTLALQRFNLLLLSVFALIAVALAAVGTYGVIAYSVAERTQEVGIRIAMGATRKNILALVVVGALRLALVGTALGLMAAVALTRVLETFLFNTGPRDPLTMVVVAGALMTVSLVAAYLPARRAIRIDPLVALRHE